MDSDGLCEICYLPIKPGEQVVRCRFCNENFHEPHLTIWISLAGSCPICKESIVEMGSDLVQQKILFRTFFTKPLGPEWGVIDDDPAAFNIVTGEQGLLAIPRDKAPSLAYTRIRKEIAPKTNNIVCIGQYNFDREGIMSLSGYSQNGKLLFRLGMVKDILGIHTSDPYYPQQATHIPVIRTKNLLFMQIHVSLTQKIGSAFLIAYCPEKILVEEIKLTEKIAVMEISFGRLGNQFTEKSLWKVIQYDERFVPDELMLPQTIKK